MGNYFHPIFLANNRILKIGAGTLLFHLNDYIRSSLYDKWTEFGNETDPTTAKNSLTR